MFDKLTPPSAGEVITVRDGLPEPTDRPIIPFIRGDGIGVDITPAMRKVVDAAVEKAYGGAKQIVWFEVYAGDAAVEVYGRGEDGAPNYLPQDTIRAISYYKVAIKGPLTTPVGGGIRSLNVAMRQIMDLFACVRPVRWFRGVPSPVKRPDLLNVVIYRENTEDVYAGIEYESDSNQANQLIDMLNGWNQKKIRRPSAIGIKPISPFGSERIVRAALRYALRRGRKSVTMVHKGNIMKFTEGAFRDWGYRLATREFRDRVVTEEDLWGKHDGEVPEGRIVLKDRIADSMFQQVLTRADEYDVIATMNLNGDYLSDACAAQVGGLGLAPGANIGDEVALFEATHGTAPKYAGQDKVNPGSLILSAHMMLEHLGWNDAADKVIRGIEGAIAARTVTYDLERLMDRARLLSCSQFADAIVDRMEDGEPRAKRPAARAAEGKTKKATTGKAEKATKAAGKPAKKAVKKAKKTTKKAVVKAKKATTTKPSSRKKPRR